MTELFMKLLNMSVNAGWLVLAVLLVRIMFHKAPKWLFPLLWSFVWIRLLMPIALESRLSVIPDTRRQHGGQKAGTVRKSQEWSGARPDGQHGQNGRRNQRAGSFGRTSRFGLPVASS